MKKFMRWTSAIKKSYLKIKLVDRCLIIFMAVLLIQSTYSLFTNEYNAQEPSAIDIMVRTTSAAIFGYFLSANFIKKSTRKAGGVTTNVASATIDETRGSGMTGQIGFSTSSEEGPQTTIGHAESAVELFREESETSHQQIIIATVIGVFSLCVLIFIRNFSDLSPAMLSTMGQLRDFVSGCVGFLLGSPGADPP